MSILSLETLLHNMVDKNFGTDYLRLIIVIKFCDEQQKILKMPLMIILFNLIYYVYPLGYNKHPYAC